MHRASRTICKQINMFLLLAPLVGGIYLEKAYIRASTNMLRFTKRRKRAPRAKDVSENK